MKKRYILLVIFLSFVGFATPDMLLTLIKHQTGKDPRAPAASMEERKTKFFAGRSDQAKVNYLQQTRAAITQDLQDKGKADFEVSKIVFTSEKAKWVAGQKQVHLSYTYQVQYSKGLPQKRSGSLVLASDGAGEMFYTSVKN